jgi:F-type H+-transporting ATPase subunit f
MSRVVSFYEKLPRGSAPEVKPKGLVGRYQAKYFGKNASPARMLIHISLNLNAWTLIILTAIIHIIAFMMAIGYAQNYYFHLRKTTNYDVQITT